MRARGGLAALLLLLLAAGPGVASAHGDLERLGPFYGGALHPLLVPAHALALLGLGLLVGQRGLAAEGRALSMLLGALLAGLGLGAAFASTLPVETLVLLLGATAALATVAQRPLPGFVLPTLAGAIGLGLGLDSVPAAGTPWMQWSGGAGTVLGVLATTTLTAALADQARSAWSRIGVRVVASWLAASALLVLALSAVDRPAPLQAQGSAGASSAITRPQDQ